MKPCDLNLLLGAAHQVTTFGGPSPRSLSFDVTSERPEQPKLSFIEVSEDGDHSGILLRAEMGKVGGATVSVKATSSSGYTGLDTTDFESWGLTPPPVSLHSQAVCRVNVVALSGIRISCPLPTSSNSEGRILVASPTDNSSFGGVPVWAEGIAVVGENGLTVTPMGLADIRPPLHFAWRLSPPMPGAPAHIFHWLSHLNVGTDDVSLFVFLMGFCPLSSTLLCLFRRVCPPEWF